MNDCIEKVRRWASIDVVQSALKYKKLSIYKKILQEDRRLIIVNDIDKNRKIYCFCGFDGAADLYISTDKAFANNFVLIDRANIEPDFEFKLDAIILNFDSDSVFTDFEMSELKKAGIKFTGQMYNKYPFIKVIKPQRYIGDISNDDAILFKFIVNTFAFAEENIKGFVNKLNKIEEPNVIELRYSEANKSIEVKNITLETRIIDYEAFKPEEPKSVLDYIGECKKTGIWEIGFYSLPFPIQDEESKEMIFDDLLIIDNHATGEIISLKISENKGKVALVDEFLLKIKNLKQVPKILFAKNQETLSFFSELAKILDIEIIVPNSPMGSNYIWTNFANDMHLSNNMINDDILSED